MPQSLPEHITAMPGWFQSVIPFQIFCDWSATLWEMSSFVHSSVSQALFPCFYGDRSLGTCQKNRTGSVQCGPWKPSTLLAMCPSKTASLSLMGSRLIPLTMVRLDTFFLSLFYFFFKNPLKSLNSGVTSLVV